MESRKLEYEFLLSKEDRIQVAVGTMNRWEILIQHNSAEWMDKDPTFQDVALLVIAGADKANVIETVYKKKRLRDLISTGLKNMRILIRLYGSDGSYSAFNHTADYYYYAGARIKL